MAKSNRSILGLLAFVALVLNFVFWIIKMINHFGWITIGGTVINALTLIASILLTIVVLAIAYDYAKARKGTTIFWWICAIITVLSMILGSGFINLAK